MTLVAGYMLPAWRPDKAMNIDKVGFADYVQTLGEKAGVNIVHFKDMVDALQKRHDYFNACGCRLSDHGIDEFYDEPYTASQIETIFSKAMRGMSLSALEIRQFKHCFLTLSAEMDAADDWTQQFHYGPIRNNNTRMFNAIGPDTGFDSIGEFNTATAMSHFFDHLAADRAGLAAGQVAVVALLQVHADFRSGLHFELVHCLPGIGDVQLVVVVAISWAASAAYGGSQARGLSEL